MSNYCYIYRCSKLRCRSLFVVYKDSLLLVKTVEKLVAEFKRIRTKLEDDLCKGRSKSASKLEIIAKIQ